MSIVLGVDTGGTYTDAVLIENDEKIIASGKALTTRQDLALGIGAAVRGVLDAANVAPGDVSMASLSTTLATNALVEGQGGRIGLIYVGFRESDLETHGLRDALKGDPVLMCRGGHDYAGSEAARLDIEAISGFLAEQGPSVSAFAVAAQFATRNPAHEAQVAAMVANQTGRPVSASHELSAKLNGPKRAMTALLNARLVGLIDRLIGRAQTTLTELGVTAPLMVVRGDGALISAAQARVHPIETILSGPAASLVGARWLTGARDAIVSDIGGTTTDVALLRAGRPALDPQGARVGPYRTMVEAVAMRTTGLGGDSAVEVATSGLQGGLTLGPRRIVPVSLIATEDPEVVHASLDKAMRSTTPGEHDARFAIAIAGQEREGLTGRDAALLDRIGSGIAPLEQVLKARIETSALQRLVERGIVQIAGVTPSDASHVLGLLDAWDKEAAHKALHLMARKRTGSGDLLAATPEAMAQMIVDQMTDQTQTAWLETVFAEDTSDFGAAPTVLARHPLVRQAFAGHSGLLRLEAGFERPVIGLGASAATYYPAVGRALNAETILPEHAGVANAIGAVVGRITMRRSGSVTAPAEGRYRVHSEGAPQDFGDLDAALGTLEAQLAEAARADATAAGADDVDIHVARDIRQADVEAQEVFVEAQITVEATGRPRLAVH
ncbi:MAG: hydantoinase/oxoprolinase family protein [Pseudomonadota bacterium]